MSDASTLRTSTASPADVAAALDDINAVWFLMEQASAVAACVRCALPESVPDRLVESVSRAMSLGDAVGELLTLAKDKASTVEYVLNQVLGKYPPRGCVPPV